MDTQCTLNHVIRTYEQIHGGSKIHSLRNFHQWLLQGGGKRKLSQPSHSNVKRLDNADSEESEDDTHETDVYLPIFAVWADVEEWIKANAKHMVIDIYPAFIDTHDGFRTHIIGVSVTDIQPPTKVLCKFSNHLLNPLRTFESKDESKKYVDLGYLFGSNIVVDVQSLEDLLMDTNIMTLGKLQDTEMIDIEKLKLSSIELAPHKIPFDGESPFETWSTHKSNQPYLPAGVNPIYSPELSAVLRDYSKYWDTPINTYLRDGDAYFETMHFKDFSMLQNISESEAKAKILDKIEVLRKGFREEAPIAQPQFTVYRGMILSEPQRRQLFSGPGGKLTVRGFSSTSTSKHVAGAFAGVTCCTFKVLLHEGFPVLSLDATTHYPNEKEILLPDNIQLEFVSYNPATQTYTVKAFHTTELGMSQSKARRSHCQKYSKAELAPFSLVRPWHPVPNKTKQDIVQESLSRDQTNLRGRNAVWYEMYLCLDDMYRKSGDNESLLRKRLGIPNFRDVKPHLITAEFLHRTMNDHLSLDNAWSEEADAQAVAGFDHLDSIKHKSEKVFAGSP